MAKLDREQLINDILAGETDSQGVDIRVRTSDYGYTAASKRLQFDSREALVSIVDVINFQEASPEKQRETAEYIADTIIGNPVPLGVKSSSKGYIYSE